MASGVQGSICESLERELGELELHVAGDGFLGVSNKSEFAEALVAGAVQEAGDVGSVEHTIKCPLVVRQRSEKLVAESD